MSKICPNCQEVFDDSHGFCSNCGSRLVDNVDVNPALNLGDANAISGGVSINQSKNITSHDTHYHTTTVQERTKSESELKLEATNQLRAKAEEIMAERGRIDSVAMNQLRPLSKQLGIDEETFKSIIKDVRSNRNGAISGLSAANARYLQQAQQAVKTNDMDALSNLTPRLEAMAAISQDDNVQFMYYLTLSILYPIKSMEVYEQQMDENYWRTFWAIISYIRTGKHAEATKVLALFDPLRYEKSEEDQNLLEAYFNIMKEDKDGAQEFLDEILGEPTEQVKPLLRAVESTLYEEEPENLEVRFYMERVMSKSDVVVKSQKKAEASAIKEEQAKTVSIPEKKAEPQSKAENAPAPEIKKDNKEAEELYAKACAASGAKRVMLLQKAADAGSLEAMYDLADCYYDGEGVDKNMPLAMKWLTKAADAGYVKAQAALGGNYYQGMEGLDQNYALSEKYLLMAAQKDNSEAQAALSLLYIEMEEFEKAMLWARKAIQTEQPMAYLALGRIYDEGLGVETDHKEGLKWFEKAADKGDADAQNIVGNIYLNADYVEHDEKKAFKYYQMAAVQGHLWAMYNLGSCYAGGQGTELDLLKAGEWLRKAAEGGLQEAIDTLNENPQFNDDFQTIEKQLTEEEAQALYDAVDKKTNPDKLIELQQAAEAGDVWGMFFYARLLTLSDSVKKNYELAVEFFTKAANAGNARAMNSLGVSYRDGRGINKDIAEATKWFQKAADAGNDCAMTNLGNCYANGNGIEQDYAEAVKWYRKAADAGNDCAMYNLGICYANGNGIEQDYAEAVKWYRKAADAGNAWAMGQLGLCYENGNGVSLDISEAIKWYRKGAEKGDAWSMKYLGVCYANGNGIEQDYAEAVKWYRKAADAGDALAMTNLGYCYENGNGIEQNYAEAVKWYRKAADAGNDCAMYNLGICYANGNGIEQDYAEAVKWYRKAADKGDADAMQYLGYCYANGNGIEQDYAEAVKWYRKAADAGNAQAMNNLGFCYTNGKGVVTDYKKAVEWYQKGIELNDAYSMSGLAWCYEFGNGVNQDYEKALTLYQQSLDKGREKDDWITERMETCECRLAEPSAIIEKIWVDENEQYVGTVNIHCSFILHNLKGLDAEVKVIIYKKSGTKNAHQEETETIDCINYKSARWDNFTFVIHFSKFKSDSNSGFALLVDNDMVNTFEASIEIWQLSDDGTPKKFLTKSNIQFDFWYHHRTFSRPVLKLR